MAVGGFVRLIPRAGAEDELRERALDVAKDVRTEPGNLFTAVFSDPDNPGELLMLEIFTDQDAIDAHRVASHTVDKGQFVHALLETPMKVTRVETLDWPTGD